MSSNFANAKEPDVAAQYAALRQAISGLRGIDIVPDEKARQDAIMALPHPPGAELLQVIHLLADLSASGAFEILTKEVGRVTKGP